MKKKVIIISVIVIFIIVVCIFASYGYQDYRDSQISLIQDNVVIEYGKSYEPTINELIDMNKFNFIDTNKVTIKSEIKNEDEKDYPAVGSYIVYLYYKDIELIQNVDIKDTTIPELTVSEKIELPYGTDLQNYDFKEYINVNDLSETKEYTIDFSNVNNQIAGEYIAKVEVEDIYSNKIQKEFKIIIQEKLEEPIKQEIPSNNVKNETKTTSNQTKAKSNTNIQKTPNTTNNKPEDSNVQMQTSTETNTNNNNQSQQVNTPYYCVEGGSHHLAGDGANEYGYYNSWDAAFSAYESYTAGWESTQFKVDQCPCGKYYFWAIK